MAETRVLAPSGPPQVRPDVLGYPSPTTSRYLIFAAALLASGLFVGSYVHNWTLGDSWQETVRVCMERFGAEGRGFTGCTADAERTRAAVTTSGALAVAVSAVGMLWLAPLVVRRRRRLRPLPEALAGAEGRFAELAREAGVADRVKPLLGQATQRDAFSFGAPGRHRVALPPGVAVRWRDRSTYDPLVRHELAHVAHRDVALAWLTRLVWLALVPLLALPVVVAVVTGDLSILGAYLWRTAILAVVVALLSSALLRSREYGADLRAARWHGDPAPMAQLVRRAASPTKRLFANHPTTEERVAVLEQPVLVTRVGFVDGLTGAFLATLAVPLLVATLSPLLAPYDQADEAYTIAAILLGPLLAGSVGLGIWRASLFARVHARDVSSLPVAGGVALGLVLGQAVSLQQSGVGSLGVDRPVWLLVGGLAGAGAVVLSAGLGHLWADAAPRLPGVRSAWVVALLLNSVVFVTLLWSTALFQSTVDAAGWEMGRLAVMSSLSPWWVFWLVLVLAAAAAAAMLLAPRGAAPTPGWMVEGGPPPEWPGVPRARLRHAIVIGAAAGVAAAVAIAVYRWSAGPTANAEGSYQRFLAYEWVAAFAAAAPVVATMLLRPRRGSGAALVAGPVAALVVTAGFTVLNMSLGGTFDLTLVREMARPGVVIGFYATMLLAPLVALAVAFLRDRSLADAAVVPVALVAVLALAGASASAAIAGRDLLVGDASIGLDDERAVERATYVEEVAPRLVRTYTGATTRGQEIVMDATLDGPTQVELLDEEVLPVLSALLADMEALRLEDPDVVDVHGDAIAGLSAAVSRYEILVETGGFPTAEDIQRLQQVQAEEAGHWQAWGDGLTALREADR